MKNYLIKIKDYIKKFKKPKNNIPTKEVREEGFNLIAIFKKKVMSVPASDKNENNWFDIFTKSYKNQASALKKELEYTLKINKKLLSPIKEDKTFLLDTINEGAENARKLIAQLEQISLYKSSIKIDNYEESRKIWLDKIKLTKDETAKRVHQNSLELLKEASKKFKELELYEERIIAYVENFIVILKNIGLDILRLQSTEIDFQGEILKQLKPKVNELISVVEYTKNALIEVERFLLT